MEAKFYIGQKVVAVKDHIDGNFKKGDVFTVIDIRKGCCNFEVNVINKKTPFGYQTCSKCDSMYDSDVIYHRETWFAPVQEISSMTYSDAIKLVETKEELKII